MPFGTQGHNLVNICPISLTFLPPKFPRKGLLHFENKSCYSLLFVTWLTTSITLETFFLIHKIIYVRCNITEINHNTESCTISYSLGVYLLYTKRNNFLILFLCNVSTNFFQNCNFLLICSSVLWNFLTKNFQMVYHIWISGLYFFIYEKRPFALGGKGLNLACFQTIPKNLLQISDPIQKVPCQNLCTCKTITLKCYCFWNLI